MGATKTKAAATKGNKLEAEKNIRQIAAAHGIKINFVKAKAKEEEDSSDDDDSDLESCESDDDE